MMVFISTCNEDRLYFHIQCLSFRLVTHYEYCQSTNITIKPKENPQFFTRDIS